MPVKLTDQLLIKTAQNTQKINPAAAVRQLMYVIAGLSCR
ncbi:hypothetical protein BN8_p06853 (plasmid) [Fibrisoma limi BUZ 3]|uniref:Uncharacterized protein n=1 Tax=Fibrisoma limi BUZ 3 TaxID=1185876 RepID=I2GU48_9BACT|nr:hypothetical protein BN8_p06853 [Fibrisoma limi BUZ 3]